MCIFQQQQQQILVADSGRNELDFVETLITDPSNFGWHIFVGGGIKSRKTFPFIIIFWKLQMMMDVCGPYFAVLGANNNATDRAINRLWQVD